MPAQYTNIKNFNDDVVIVIVVVTTGYNNTV